MIGVPLTEPPGALRRQLNLPLLVLYGVGITVGAGIYVLIGAVAGHAGVRYRRVRSAGPHVSVPIWVPAAGLVTCVAMIASALLK